MKRGVAALLLALIGCTSPDERACRVGGDCASGVCNLDGTCGSAATADAAPSSDTVSGPDAAVASSGCANHDGTIDRTEVTLAPDEHETMLIAVNAAINTAGATQPDGTRVWDFSGPLAGDHDATITTINPAGAWWASQFPDATYAAQLTDSSTLLGVFRATATELQLIGVVSPDGMLATRTLLTYSPAAVILRFPLAAGASFSTTSTVTGQAPPLYAAIYTETYDSQVDATGTLATPFGTFPVLRVRTTLTRTVGGFPTVTRSFDWVAECYGTVGTATSNAGETQAEFTTAAEARRLAP